MSPRCPKPALGLLERAAGRGGRLGRRAVIPSHMYSNTPIVPPSSNPTPPSAPIPLRLLPPLPPGPAIPQRLLSMTMAVLSDTVILAALGCALAMGVAQRTRTQNDSTLASRLCRGQGLARTTLAMLQRVSHPLNTLAMLQRVSCGPPAQARCVMWRSFAYRSMVLVIGFFGFWCCTQFPYVSLCVCLQSRLAWSSCWDNSCHRGHVPRRHPRPAPPRLLPRLGRTRLAPAPARPRPRLRPDRLRSGPAPGRPGPGPRPDRASPGSPRPRMRPGGALASPPNSNTASSRSTRLSGGGPSAPQP